MVGARTIGQRLGWDRGQPLGGLVAAKAVQQGFGHPEWMFAILGLRLDRGGAGSGDQPVQHLHEQARDRQVRPFGIGGDMEQHQLPLPHPRLRDQRRVVTERGDDPFAEIGRGLRHQLRAHRHVVGGGQPGENAVAVEIAQGTRIAPAERAADIAPALTQPHRQQRLVRQCVIGAHARPGKADQQPAILDPSGQFIHLGQIDLIGQHDDIGGGVQHIAQAPLDQIGGRGQRPAQVMQRRQQLLPLGLTVGGTDQPDLVPPHPVVGQHHGTGMGGALDLKAGDAVAQFGRQVDGDGPGGDTARYLRLARLQAGQLSRGALRVGADGQHHRRGLVAGGQAQGGRFATLQCKGADGRCRGQNGQAAGLGQGTHPDLTMRIVQPVGDPQGRKAPGWQTGQRSGGILGQLSGPCHRLRGAQARQQAVGGLEGQRPLMAPIGQQQRGRAACGGGLGQGAFGAGLTGGPVGGCGPARIHHHQQRPIGIALRRGFPDRPGKGQNQRPDRRQPQQQQPPRRAPRHRLAVHQPPQQRHARKGDQPRAGRHGAQDQPQHRQRDQRRQHPGRDEAKGSQYQHQSPST